MKASGISAKYMCEICDVRVDHFKKDTIEKHCESQRHKSKKEKTKQGNRGLIETSAVICGEQ